MFDRLASFFSLSQFAGEDAGSKRLELELQERSLDFGAYPPLSSQLAALRAGRRTSQAWRLLSIREALQSPAILRAVLMISNTVGSLSLDAFRNGARMAPDDRPSIIKRPNPHTTPREFGRTIAFDLASAGEAWLWVAKRDADDLALSVVPVAPQEVSVRENPDDASFPIREWRGKEYSPRDLRQIVLTRLPGDLRGSGPLQLCGAAVSVAIEAQDWAANFFATGGTPSIIVKSAIPLGADPDADPDDEDALTEAELLAADWMSKPHNLPRVIDPSIEKVEALELNQSSAAMLEARMHSNGEAATMFGMPGSLLNYSMPGSSLTYQNVQQELDKWVRTSLAPDYLEPIEQELGDLLPRGIVTRFAVSGLLRADEKTRFDTYKTGAEAGLPWIQDFAAQREGIEPGDVEVAPVPFAPPAATPPAIVERARPEPIEVRCAGKVVRAGLLRDCGRLLGRLVEPYEIQCPRCRTIAVAPARDVSPVFALPGEAPLAIVS